MKSAHHTIIRPKLQIILYWLWVRCFPDIPQQEVIVRCCSVRSSLLAKSDLNCRACRRKSNGWDKEQILWYLLNICLNSCLLYRGWRHLLLKIFNTFGLELVFQNGAADLRSHFFTKVNETIFSEGQMGAYTNMQNFSQIGQNLKNLIFKGQPHILLKMCNFWHYFA